MKRDVHTRSLILRGYLNLALYFAVLIILLLPTAIYPGARGIRIALLVCGICGRARSWGEAFQAQMDVAFLRRLFGMERSVFRNCIAPAPGLMQPDSSRCSS